MKYEATQNKTQILFGDDSIVIQKYISGIKGGRTLDLSNFAADHVKAGHVIVKLSNGNYAPMPVAEGGEAYAALPEGATYAGVLYRSVLATNAQASIMTNGEVNSVAAPFPMTAIAAAFKTACPHVVFIADEEA